MQITQSLMKRFPNAATAEKFTCLVVDDDPGLVGMFAKIVREEGGLPTVCHSITDARVQITKQAFDLAILDNRLPDGTGYEFHPQLVQANPECVAVMITGAPELSQAVELTRNGLFDYLTKPVDQDDFAALIRRARLRLGRAELESPDRNMLGNSAAMKDVYRQLQQASQHLNAPVLLLGETGTGKDLAARMLHRLTFADRAEGKPYIPVNCPNIPAEMFEAELFGSEKGAYTGADRRRTGLVEAADGGTLFLDEVGEIPLLLQSKLLRFLEMREYRPLGGSEMRHFTGRVAAATNRSLIKEVEAAAFVRT